jgi:hypothetical protein
LKVDELCSDAVVWEQVVLTAWNFFLIWLKILILFKKWTCRSIGNLPFRQIHQAHCSIIVTSHHATRMIHASSSWWSK